MDTKMFFDFEISAVSTNQETSEPETEELTDEQPEEPLEEEQLENVTNKVSKNKTLTVENDLSKDAKCEEIILNAPKQVATEPLEKLSITDLESSELVYRSSSKKAFDLAPFILIFVLLIIIAVLVWEKR